MITSSVTATCPAKSLSVPACIARRGTKCVSSATSRTPCSSTPSVIRVLSACLIMEQTQILSREQQTTTTSTLRPSTVTTWMTTLLRKSASTRLSSKRLAVGDQSSTSQNSPFISSDIPSSVKVAVIFSQIYRCPWMTNSERTFGISFARNLNLYFLLDAMRCVLAFDPNKLERRRILKPVSSKSISRGYVSTLSITGNNNFPRIALWVLPVQKPIYNLSKYSTDLSLSPADSFLSAQSHGIVLLAPFRYSPHSKKKALPLN